MVVSKIYFLKNEDWYKLNEETGEYEITEKAPLEAKMSYEAFKELKKVSYFGATSEENKNKMIELSELVAQPEASKKYDEEQQAKQIYGGF